MRVSAFALRLSAFALALCGCAGSAGSVKQTRIELPAQVITAGPPEEIALADKDAAALFDGGTRAFAAGDYEKATLHFDRLAEVFPDSANALPSLYDAGLAQERLKHWDAALIRFDQYLTRAMGGPGAAPAPTAAKDATYAKDATDAQFHAALAEHQLGKLDAAAARLQTLSDQAGLPLPRKGEALVQEAVCRVEQGARAEGERLLRAALVIYGSDADDAVDPALPAQAEFWLGEIYRSYFNESKLDPHAMAAKALGDALETKAQFLLSAQGHYLRAIRRGDGEWATASGFRIGELYEAFHDQLVNAPVPAGLSGEAQGVYREELTKKVRVLVEKAIRIYEQTLEAAQRVGAQSAYVQRTGEALERLRKLLLDAPSSRLRPSPPEAAPPVAPAAG